MRSKHHHEILPPRNAPCPCKSGKKYKKCCWLVRLEKEREATIAWHTPPKDPKQVQAEAYKNLSASDAGRNRPGKRVMANPRAGSFIMAAAMVGTLAMGANLSIPNEKL